MSISCQTSSRAAMRFLSFLAIIFCLLMSSMGVVFPFSRFFISRISTKISCSRSTAISTVSVVMVVAFSSSRISRSPFSRFTMDDVALLIVDFALSESFSSVWLRYALFWFSSFLSIGATSSTIISSSEFTLYVKPNSVAFFIISMAFCFRPVIV